MATTETSGLYRNVPPPGQGRAASTVMILLICLSTTLGACKFSADAETWHTVAYVNDGDTVVLANADRQPVRYLGIDTPEIDHKRKTAEPMGYAARKFNQDLVLKKMIRLEFDKNRTDRYGRWLAYVYLEDGTFVNQVLLANGYGYFQSKKPNTRHDTVLLAAQRSAMQARTGIWQGWRESKGDYVGNRHSRLLHHSNCPNARKISRKNRIVFSSRWKAFWEGYTPARGCKN